MRSLSYLRSLLSTKFRFFERTNELRSADSKIAQNKDSDEFELAVKSKPHLPEYVTTSRGYPEKQPKSKSHLDLQS